jgi:hypothetical protein
MADLLFWLYLVNSVLLINHEIDSAYWKEWDLFNGIPDNPFPAPIFYLIWASPSLPAFLHGFNLFANRLCRWNIRLRNSSIFH